MKKYEVIKCKRLAMGMTQSEFGEEVGVTGNTISRFESGEEMTPLVYKSILYGMDRLTKSLRYEDYVTFQIVYRALMLKDIPEDEKLKTLSFINLNTSKLALKIMENDERVDD